MNPYLDQLVRDCQDLVDNIDDWIKTEDDSMLEEAIENIKKDIDMYKGG